MSQSRKGKKRGPYGSAGNLSAYDDDIVLQCSPVKCSHSTVMKKLRDQLKLKKIVGRARKSSVRLLMIDLAAPFSTEIGQNVCEALENLFSLACSVSGPSRIPFFSVMALHTYPELLLPFSYVRNNFPRIQTAVTDVRAIMESLGHLEQSGSCIEQGLVEACSHYGCQLQSTPQTGAFCHQLEIVILTCQSGTRIQKLVESTAASLNLEHLKRIQVVSVSSLGSLMDNLSQTSLSSDHSSTNSIGGMVEVINIEPDFLCLQNYFNNWLLDNSTDSEHLHLILPPTQEAAEVTLLKCDLHERLLHPAQLPYHGQFTVHSDTATLKMVFPSPSKAIGMVVPVYRLQVTNTIPITALCDSIIFGMPMLVTATSCWKVDWDELEKNQQQFKALCHTLVSKDLALIAYLCPDEIDQKQIETYNSETVHQPLGRFVLIPGQNGNLLIKSIAVQELMLPCQTGSHNEEPSDENLNTISESLDKMGVSNPRDDRAEQKRGSAQHSHPEGWKCPATTEPHIGFFFLHNTTEKLKRIYVVCLGKNTRLECLETYNPLNQSSFLYSCLKNNHKKPAVRQQKRHLDSKSCERPSTSSSGKMSRKSYPLTSSYRKENNTSRSTTSQQSAASRRNGIGGSCRNVLQESHQPRLFENFDDDDDFDDDEYSNTVRYRSGHFSRRQPMQSFPTSL